MKDYQCFGNCKNRNNERVLYKASLQKHRSGVFFNLKGRDKGIQACNKFLGNKKDYKKFVFLQF